MNRLPAQTDPRSNNLCNKHSKKKKLFQAKQTKPATNISNINKHGSDMVLIRKHQKSPTRVQQDPTKTGNPTEPRLPPKKG
jgi:hypothetical protein